MTVRIGFLGCGFIAAYHLAMLRAGDAVAEVTAVFDLDRDRARRFAAGAGARAAASEDDVIEGSDAVYVTTWTAEHRRLVEKVVSAGRAVFCEKPLATSLADAVALAAAVERAGVVNQVGLVLRDSPAFLLFRHLVRRPVSGRLMAVVFRDDQYLPVQGLYGSTWRADVTRAGAGTLLEHSIHDLDLLEWIGGPIVEVGARAGDFHGIAGIEDVAQATLRYADGGLAVLTSVWHDVLARPSLRRVEALCERAHYVLEGDVDGPVGWTVQPSGELAGQDGGALDADDGFGTAGRLQGGDLVAALAERGIVRRNPDLAFVHAVAEGVQAYPSIGSAVRAHVLADAAYRSAAAAPSGTALAVPPG